MRNKGLLLDSKDFWNVPCNPITGYRITTCNRNSYRKVKENFLKIQNYESKRIKDR